MHSAKGFVNLFAGTPIPGKTTTTFSLNVLLYCFLECPDWAIELRERHRLFNDILRLAQKLHVEFAFPTQTLHMFNHSDDPLPEETPIPDSTRDGQRLAAEIAGPLQGVQDRPGPVSFSGPSNLGNTPG